MNEPPDISGDSDQAANELFTPGMRLLELQTQHRALDVRINEIYDFAYQNQILLQRLK